MATLKEKYGDYALVTGASSGIGMAFCELLAEQKINIVAVARRQDRLETLAQTLVKQHNIEVYPLCVDLSRDDFLDDISDKTAHLDVGLLINNAGFAMTGEFIKLPLENSIKLLNVNCRAPMMLAHYFLQRFTKRKSAGIINIASVAGMQPMPYWSHYAATKSYMCNFSQALWYESIDRGIDVLTLCPGTTKTEFAEIAGTQATGNTPDYVARMGLKHIGRKPIYIVGTGNKIITSINRLLSRQFLIKMGAFAVKSMMPSATKSVAAPDNAAK